MSAIEIKAAAGDDGWGDYDGLCTLFNLQIGNDTQKQNFRFVPSTSSFDTWLPSSERCVQIISDHPDYPLFPSNLDDCAEQCGVGNYNGDQNIGFNTSLSESSYIGLQSETMDLGSTLKPGDLFGTRYASGSYDAVGLDLVSLQLAGNNSWYQAPNRTVIFGVTTLLYMLPTLGLGFGQIVTNLGTSTSFMNTVADTFVIPSRSWGYTSGAHYEPKNAGTQGSFVLGGYDRGRIKPGTTGMFGISNQTYELLVNIAAININWSDQPQTSSTDLFPAVIDSTLPYMQLPEAVCTFFADKFNLTEDSGTGIYFVDNSVADANSRHTADISFVVQDALDGSGQTTIKFPYSAFNASLHWSWGNSNKTTIFPIRKMNKTAVLGRAFLQEAYLFANYEPDNMTFQLSQTVLDNPSSNIVSVHSSRGVVPPPKRLSSGAIAGIVIGVVAVVALNALAIWWFVRRKKKQRKEATMKGTSTEKREAFSNMEYAEGDPRRGTISNTWSEGTYGRSEIDAASPGAASSMRPGYGHRRGESNASELSSESEHQTGHILMGTLHEMPDNSHAAELEECQEGRRGQDAVPQELEGSHGRLKVNPPRSPDPTSPSTHSTSTPNLRSSPAPPSSPRPSSVAERT